MMDDKKRFGKFDFEICFNVVLYENKRAYRKVANERQHLF